MVQVNAQDARRCGAKLGGLAHQTDFQEVNRLAMKLLGALTEASTYETRRRALEKALRMLKTR